MNPSIDAVALLPELSISLLLVVVLVADLISERVRTNLHIISAVGLLVPLASVVGLAIAQRHASLLSGGYVVDDFSLLAKGLVISSALLVLMLGLPQRWRGEYCVLMLAALLGMTMIASARELISFFVAFELLAVPGYILVGWDKTRQLGHEAAMKYYLLGVIATAVLLYGISLLFGVAGSTLFSDIAEVLGRGSADLALTRLAILFVIVGLAFKISAVPFHFWAPDAYNGAPIPVAAFVSVASKAAAFVALMSIVALALPDAGATWAPLLWGLAALSMTAGNLLALRQTDVVRLLAYSSIAQGGFLLVPLAAAGPNGGGIDSAVAATLEYLLIYSASNFGAFAVVHVIVQRTRSTSITSLRGLFSTAPVLAVLLTAFLLSLAGIPPFGGWFAKLAVLRAGLDGGTAMAVGIVVVAAVNTALGLVYYARVVRHMWIPADEPAQPASIGKNSSGITAALSVAAAVVLITGVLPGLVTHLGELSSLIR